MLGRDDDLLALGGYLSVDASRARVGSPINGVES
jgi:hypothetical protein